MSDRIVNLALRDLPREIGILKDIRAVLEKDRENFRPHMAFVFNEILIRLNTLSELNREMSSDPYELTEKEK